MLAISSQLQSPRLTAEVGHLWTSGPLEPEYVFFLEDLGGLIVTRAACMSIFLIFSEHRSAGSPSWEPQDCAGHAELLCVCSVFGPHEHILYTSLSNLQCANPDHPEFWSKCSLSVVAEAFALTPWGAPSPWWIKGSTRTGGVRMRQGPPQTVSTDTRRELLSGSRRVFKSLFK